MSDSKNQQGRSYGSSKQTTRRTKNGPRRWEDTQPPDVIALQGFIESNEWANLETWLNRHNRSGQLAMHWKSVAKWAMGWRELISTTYGDNGWIMPELKIGAFDMMFKCDSAHEDARGDEKVAAVDIDALGVISTQHRANLEDAEPARLTHEMFSIPGRKIDKARQAEVRKEFDQRYTADVSQAHDGTDSSGNDIDPEELFFGDGD